MNEKVVFESAGGWLQVIETANKFYFARRKGKDSVAVFLVRQGNEGWEVLIRRQPLPLLNRDTGDDMELYSCPITGGYELNESAETCALREAYEEAGYKLDKLSYLGGYIVGTQTDEYVDMFWADVTNVEPSIPTQDGTVFEAASENKWMPIGFLDMDGSYAALQIGFLRLKEDLALTEVENIDWMPLAIRLLNTCIGDVCIEDRIRTYDLIGKLRSKLGEESFGRLLGTRYLELSNKIAEALG
jgi:8-oxo-dGTP pyrophosphatase MutT (NUDIX family)